MILSTSLFGFSFPDFVDYRPASRRLLFQTVKCLVQIADWQAQESNNMKIIHTSICTMIAMIMANVAAQEAKIIVTGVSTGIKKETGVAPARLNIIDMYEEGGPAW